MNLIEEARMKRPCFATVSVDDGHPADLKVLDLLTQYGVKATFYIPVRNAERPVMHRSEVRLLARHCEIGGHTLNHVRLTSLPERAVVREVVDGKKWLEDLLGAQIESFCYPGGKFDRQAAAIVKQAGFLGARTTMCHLTGFPVNPYLWGVSTHACRHSRIVHVRHAVLERNLEGLWSFFRLSKGLTDWERQFLCTVVHVERNGGIAHLYLHGWEIEQHGEWDKLERVLQVMSERKSLIKVTNGELFRLWQTRNYANAKVSNAAGAPLSEEPLSGRPTAQ
jgi:peptidoglycan/xylan/chitin deacetylase (PgdA/CDA1 family)